MLTRTMALRVLLADESATIKKVFQLALQDYAVEVTAVAVGIDVAQVAEKIKPDIIFADVLLQKKNGYDVCQELKTIDHLSRIPVVLIWSGFMELDAQKYKSCGANGHLEKPFDTKKLRGLIQDLVPKTKTQNLSDFLTFPKMPPFEESQPRPAFTPTPALDLSGGIERSRPAIPTPPHIPTSSPQYTAPPLNTQPAAPIYTTPQSLPPMAPSPISTPSSVGTWSMDSFAALDPLPESEDVPDFPVDSRDDFMQVSLPTEPIRSAREKIEPDDEEIEWVNHSLSRYKLTPDKQKEDVAKIRFKVPEEKIDPNTVGQHHSLSSQHNTDDERELDDSAELELESDDKPPIPTTMPAPMKLSEKELEAVLRAQSIEVIEKIVWQIVPEIATRVIEREIERLLKERNERK